MASRAGDAGKGLKPKPPENSFKTVLTVGEPVVQIWQKAASENNIYYHYLLGAHSIVPGFLALYRDLAQNKVLLLLPASISTPETQNRKSTI